MIGEQPLYAMCIGCPVDKETIDRVCHANKGMAAFEHGNVCYLKEELRRKEATMNYIIETTTGHVLAEGKDKDAAIAEARNIEPNDTLIGTEVREDGTQAGFMVGKLVGMGF